MSMKHRTPYTTAMKTLGTIPPDDAHHDVIRLFAEPMTAGQDLWPGQPVVVKEGVAFSANDDAPVVSVADPFLRETIKEGDRFWCVFPPVKLSEKEHEARRCLFHFCRGNGLDYYGLWEMVEEINAGQRQGLVGDEGRWYLDNYDDAWGLPRQYLRVLGEDEAECNFPDEFWDYVEVVTGKAIPESLRSYEPGPVSSSGPLRETPPLRTVRTGVFDFRRPHATIKGMDIKRAYKYRFYPTAEQAGILARTFGSTRFVYNHMLQVRSDAWKERQERIGYTETSAMLTDLKKSPEHAWLNEVSSVPVQQALRHLQTAFSNFFAKRAEYPTFKSRYGKQAAEYTASGFRWDGTGFRKPRKSPPSRSAKTRQAGTSSACCVMMPCPRNLQSRPKLALIWD